MNDPSKPSGSRAFVNPTKDYNVRNRDGTKFPASGLSVFIHEIIHVFRMGQGTSDTKQTVGPFPNEDEKAATGAAEEYRQSVDEPTREKY